MKIPQHRDPNCYCLVAVARVVWRGRGKARSSRSGCACWIEFPRRVMSGNFGGELPSRASGGGFSNVEKWRIVEFKLLIAGRYGRRSTPKDCSVGTGADRAVADGAIGSSGGSCSKLGAGDAEILPPEPSSCKREKQAAYHLDGCWGSRIVVGESLAMVVVLGDCALHFRPCLWVRPFGSAHVTRAEHRPD